MISKSCDMIKRFIYIDEDFLLDKKGKWDTRNVNTERVSRRIMRTLRWRKEFGLNHIQASHFPESFYRSKMYSYTILEKRFMMYYRICKFKKINKEVSASITAAAMFELNRLCNKFAAEYENGIVDLNPVIVFVMTGVKITQLEWKVCNSTLSLINTHFPGSCHEYWLWGIPEYLHHVVRLFNKTLPPAIYAKTKLQNVRDAAEILGRENIPRFLGGESQIVPSSEMPDKVASLEEYAARFNIQASEIDKVRQYFDEILEDDGALT